MTERYRDKGRDRPTARQRLKQRHSETYRQIGIDRRDGDWKTRNTGRKKKKNRAGRDRQS